MLSHPLLSASSAGWPSAQVAWPFMAVGHEKRFSTLSVARHMCILLGSLPGPAGTHDGSAQWVESNTPAGLGGETWMMRPTRTRPS
jgi:hypothetical protein